LITIAPREIAASWHRQLFTLKATIRFVVMTFGFI
jgi:hypothetical protein